MMGLVAVLRSVARGKTGAPVDAAAELQRVKEREAAVSAELDRVEKQLAESREALPTLHAERIDALRRDDPFRAEHLKGRIDHVEDRAADHERVRTAALAERDSLAAQRAEVEDRIEKARRAEAHREAAATLIAACATADAAVAAATAEAEDVLTTFEHYRIAARADGANVPDNFPLGLVLSAAWCKPKIMQRMGTSFELSLSTAVAGGRLTFSDCVKHLRKEEK